MPKEPTYERNLVIRARDTEFLKKFWEGVRKAVSIEDLALDERLSIDLGDFDPREEYDRIVSEDDEFEVVVGSNDTKLIRDIWKAFFEPATKDSLAKEYIIPERDFTLLEEDEPQDSKDLKKPEKAK